MFPKWTFVATAPVVLLAALTGPARAGTLSASASCGDGNLVSFHWDYLEWTGNLTGHPEWVGYDVLRRSIGACSPFERVNAEPFPRVVGKSHGHTYTETAPRIGTTYEYRVILVDASRNEVFLGASECECQAGVGWASCPNLSAPLTQGTLDDWGWALYVNPCPLSCYRGFYFEGPIADELRPYVGRNVGFLFYGSAYCGTVEGCGMTVDRYEMVWCDAVNPVVRTTWGRLKTIYR